MFLSLGIGDDEIYMGGVMTNQCPLCNKRVQDWQMASGKSTTVYNRLVHIACLMDVKPSEVERDRLKLITEVKDV